MSAAAAGVELTKEEEKTDWYGVLGLHVSADETAISKAFKKLSLRWHPDKNKGSQEANDMFMRVKEAKLFLLDGKKRKVYDEKRAARHKMETLLVRVHHSSTRTGHFSSSCPSALTAMTLVAASK